MRSRTFAALGATMVVGALGSGCPSLSPFRCEDDAQCDRSPDGTCLGDGCAYPDDSCPGLGLRYSENAREHPNECVMLFASATGSSSDSIADTGSSSGAATTGLTSCGEVRELELEVGLLGPTSLPGFPALVVVPPEAGLAADASADASDVWFATADGTVLPHELDAWDPATGELAAWVRLPGWEVGAPLVLLLHTGDVASAPPPTPTAVWADDYAGVWHLGDALDDARNDLVRDSTVLANHGFAIGGMGSDQQVDGVVGGALQLDGDDDEIQIEADFVGMLESFTISAWVRIDGDDSTAHPLFQQLNGTLFPRCRRLDATAGGNFFCQVELEGEAELLQVGASDGLFGDGELTHVALTWDAELGELRLFVDGEQVDMGTVGATVPVGGVDGFGLGRIEEFGTLDGMLDEVRVSLQALAPERIAADHRNQRTPSNLVTTMGTATSWPCP